MDTIRSLLDRQRPGWSLEQDFYLDPEIFALEQERWFSQQWVVIAHASELPQKGSYIVRDLFDTSILLVNSGEGGLRAFHNVCTHRGSRICKDDGRAPLLVCPYHAWSFRLSGELQSRKELPEGIDPATLGLHAVALCEIGGLVFCGVEPDLLPDPRPAQAALSPILKHHGIDRARILERRSYPTRANWKLVLENFYECYHCRPSHPEYFRMNGHVSVTAMRDEQAASEWEANVSAWRGTLQETEVDQSVRCHGDIGVMRYASYRQPIGLERQTHSRDGRPAAPLMGDFVDYDGGETALHLGRFGFMGAYNDHAVLFQFVPKAVDETDVTVSWFVDDSADTEALDVEAITFLWDVTTRQDKQIIEENAAGVRSKAYRPGPYTRLEEQSAGFVADYLDVMRRLLENSD